MSRHAKSPTDLDPHFDHRRRHAPLDPAILAAEFAYLRDRIAELEMLLLQREYELEVLRAGRDRGTARETLRELADRLTEITERLEAAA